MSAPPVQNMLAAGRWRPGEIALGLMLPAIYLLFPTHLVLAAQILIAGLFALSLDLLIGYAGLISLGHAAYFGVGAYAAGLLAQAGWGEPFSGLLVAAGAAMALGWGCGHLIVRVQGLAMLMITLGLVVVLHEAANKAAHITGGDDGLQGVVMFPLFGLFAFDLYGRTAYLYTAGVVLALVLAARRLVQSPFGLALRGLRENTLRMQAIGSPHAARIRTIHTLAAGMAGVAGGLLAQTTEFVSLETLSFQRSAEVLIMLILGGAGRLYGGLIGAALFLIARDALASASPQYWYFWLGLGLMGVVLVARGGVLGGLDRLRGLIR